MPTTIVFIMLLVLAGGCSGGDVAGGGAGVDTANNTTSGGGTSNADAGDTDDGMADTTQRDTTPPEDTAVPPDDTAVSQDTIQDTGPTACLRDDDCEPPERCRAEGDPPMFACGPTDGADAPGTRCTDNDDCSSNLCIDGLCSTACTDDSDCPEALGFTCATPQEDWPTVCIGPLICNNNGDCPDSETCTFLTDGLQVLAACTPDRSARPEGALCENDGTCEGGLCSSAGRCLSPCLDGADCADPLACVVIPTPMDGDAEDARIRACTLEGEPCGIDTDCMAPEVCAARRLIDHVAWVCAEPDGSSQPGEPCQSDLACRHALCEDNTCRSACQQNEDCNPTTGTLCRSVEVMVEEGSVTLDLCSLPDACNAADDCTEPSTVCFVRPVGVDDVDLACRPPNAPGSATGTPCVDHAACATNLCLESWVTQVCSEPCVDDEDCGLQGYRCLNVPLRDGAAASTRTACVPPDPQGCQTDADCPEGLACVVLPDADATTLVTACLPPPGTGQPGVGCTESDSCAAGLCLDGLCSGPCLDRSSCDQEQACEETEAMVDGVSGTLQLCRAPALVECGRSADCAEDGRVCGRLTTDGSAAPQCNFPIDDGADIGEDCEGRFSPNNTCRDRVCLRNVTDTCTTPCIDDADCASQAEGYMCTDIQFTPIIRLCADGCIHDMACPDPDHLCGLSRNETDDRFDFICRNPMGDDPTGTDCSQQINCDHGICLIRNTNGMELERRCTQPCDTDADCPAALPACDIASIGRPQSGEVQELRVCTVR